MTEPAVCVEIVHNEVKIGDTLCVLPLILQLARIGATDVHVTGAFAEPVKALVPRLPICFTEPDGDATIVIRVEIASAYRQGLSQDLHMTASLCRLACVPVPALPVTLDLAVAPVALPPGIVLSPFSGSANPWYKVWPLQRWLEVAQHLAASQDLPVYILGAGGDAAEPFAEAGAIPLTGLKLPAVLQIMRDAAVFVSIDNGLSHLAHFGTVKRHLLIYPVLLPPRLVVNPWARVLREPLQDIGVSRIIGHIEAMMGEKLADDAGSAAGLLQEVQDVPGELVRVLQEREVTGVR